MKRHMRLTLMMLLLSALAARPMVAQNRFIARDTNGLSGLQSVCAVIGCNVGVGLDGSLGQVFLVTTSSLVDPTAFLQTLLKQPGVVDAELDQLSGLRQASGSGIPSGLYDTQPVKYFGTTVWHGYVNQPAAQIVNLAYTQTTFNVSGSGIVAVIDTGVDPNQPVLQKVLVTGYDFTRNQAGGSEMADLNQSTVAVVDGSQPAYVNQSTVAVVDQSTVAVVDNSQYAAFGHGTMVAGVIHLVAPKAMIMSLKAFKADGSGYLSDILRATYYAAQNNAKVINMSFSFSSYSQEMLQAIKYASSQGLVCVAAAGNNGAQSLVYPAAYNGYVMGVASTTNNDTRSSFSNYGSSLVWVAAPGEGIITTYPWGSYAAAWGTSFSAPFVSGAVALLLDEGKCNESQGSQAVAYAKYISSDLGNGRLDSYQAVKAWRKALGY